MIYTGHNNWYQYGYNDDNRYQRRISPDQQFSIRYFIDNDIKSLSFLDALDYNLKIFLDDYPNEKYGLLLSGGSDSEVVFRTLMKNKIDFVPYIFRYENDINIYDVSYAITLCQSYEKDYKLIDLNLKKFYENEAEKISEMALIDRPRLLPILKFLDYIDEMIISAGGDPMWTRRNNNYEELGTWEKIEFESFLNVEKYASYINRKSSMHWLRYTPELTLAYDQTDWINMLINDKFYGKLGTRSTKFQAYKEVYPEMLFRKKKTGYEKIEHLMDEFEKFLEKKYNGLIHRGSVVVKTHLAVK